MKQLIMFCLPFMLLACKHSTSDESTEKLFSIYTLKDSTITPSAAFSTPIESLILADAPFVTANDLKSYTWSKHTFELKPDMEAKWEHYGRYSGSTKGVPFVVAVGKEKIYLGTFWWAYSSSMPPSTAVIDALFPSPNRRIYLANGASDKRSDSRIYNSLKQSGVLVE
jgi:hypothetical protein